MFKKLVLGLTLALLVAGLVGLAQDAPKYGGTLEVAIFDESPMLDMSMTTADLCTLIGHHIFEGLFEDDGNLEPKPHLVDTYEISDDGLLATLHLRHGVFFHNGKEMTSEDVLASLNRFIDYTPRGPLLAPFLDHIAAPDAYTIELYLSQTCGALTAILAFTNGGAIIVPKEIAEAAGDEPIAPENCIGTGPYEFDEWLPGRHLRLVRFDDYVSRGGEAFGYWGARTAYLDAIEFIPVPEVGTRVAGLEAGTYDYATEISADLFDQLDSDSGLQTLVVNPASYPYYIFNTKEGIMANVKMRQAILAALDMEPIMRAAFGPEALWDVSGSIYPPSTIWYSDAGTEFYNQANPERAKQLAAEAGYNGEPIRFMTTTSYKFMYDMALVGVQQLEDAGFNIDLQVYDWATVVSRRVQPALWDIFTTNDATVGDPSIVCWLSDAYPGWWTEPEKYRLVEEITATVDFETRFEIWEEFQEFFWDQVYLIRLGDYYDYYAATADLKGVGTDSHPVMKYCYFWNVWLDK